MGIYHISQKNTQFQNTQNNSFYCNTDNDCVIKTTANCCGPYPRCMNKNYTPNITQIKQNCEKEKEVGICGFRTPESCKCINHKCTNVYPSFK